MESPTNRQDGLTGAQMDALAEVLRGQGYQVTCGPGSGRPAGDAGVALTAREVEVIRALWRHESAKGAGEALHIATATVNRHQDRVCARVGVRGRTALFRWALEHGVLRPEEGPLP